MWCATFMCANDIWRFIAVSTFKSRRCDVDEVEDARGWGWTPWPRRLQKNCKTRPYSQRKTFQKANPALPPKQQKNTQSKSLVQIHANCDLSPSSSSTVLPWLSFSIPPISLPTTQPSSSTVKNNVGPLITTSSSSPSSSA